MNERAGCLGKSLSRVLLQLGKENDKRQKAKGKRRGGGAVHSHVWASEAMVVKHTQE